MNKYNELSYLKSNERVEKAYKHWLNQKLTCKELSKIYKTNPLKIRRLILLNHPELENPIFRHFEVIDTEEKAYWLGFLYADGSISEKRSEIELSLKPSDSGHLQKFKDFLGSKNKIGVNKTRCRFTQNCKFLKDDLILKGCYPKKSLTVKFPNHEIVPAELMRHFIRGVFDGDGCIYKTCKDCMFSAANLCSGSNDFIKGFVDYVESIFDFKIQIYRRSKGSNTFNVYFDGKKYKDFAKWIYWEATIYLDRKYERFINSTAVVLCE